MKINQTKDYASLHFVAENRPLNTSHSKFRALLASMKKHGFLQSFPLTVVLKNGRTEVVDGQNRLTAAKMLGLPVAYVIVEAKGQIDIPELNGTQRPWALTDYAASHQQQGNQHYHYLIEFAKRNKVSIAVGAALLSGNVAHGRNEMDVVKEGRFTVRNVEIAERIIAIANAFGKHVPWSRHKLLLAAISRACLVPQFKDAEFIKKLDANVSMLRTRATLADFSDMLEEIYNSRSRAPIPLRFLCEKAARDRNPATRAAA